MEKLIKDLEKDQGKGRVRRNLGRPVNRFETSEAVEQLEALVTVARKTLYKMSDEYAAILD